MSVKRGRRRLRIATLTPREDRAWVHTFTFYLDRRYSQARADERTWRQMQREFPRLRHFDGCRS